MHQLMCQVLTQHCMEAKHMVRPLLKRAVDRGHHRMEMRMEPPESRKQRFEQEQSRRIELMMNRYEKGVSAIGITGEPQWEAVDGEREESEGEEAYKRGKPEHVN